jgi:1,4-dihydroxy-2-naphthoate octaprenyltransferase
VTAVDRTAGAAAGGEVARHGRLWAYSKLAKLAFFDYYLSALVVWTLLPPDLRTDPRALLVLVLCTVGWLGTVAATVAFDDVTGYRDGSDARNYDPEQEALRDRARKPLLDGHLSVEAAVRFGWASVAVAAVALAAAVAVAPHRPLWTVLLVPFVLLISANYSYGLKLSYRGFQELVILTSTGLTILIPYGLATGTYTGMVGLLTYLFGLWSLMVSVYSNLNDVAGDRAAGRRSLAVRAPRRVYRGMIVALTVSEPAAILLALAVGAVPAWYPLFLLPVLWLRARQARTGLRQDNPLGARKLGVKAHRLGVVMVLAATLLAVR